MGTRCLDFSAYKDLLSLEATDRIIRQCHSIMGDMKFLPEMIRRMQSENSATFRLLPRDGFFAVADPQFVEFACAEFQYLYDALVAQHIVRMLVDAVVNTQARVDAERMVGFEPLFRKAWDGLSLLKSYGIIVFGNYQHERVAEALKALEGSSDAH